jgi:hypothetical protein
MQDTEALEQPHIPEYPSIHQKEKAMKQHNPFKTSRMDTSATKPLPHHILAYGTQTLDR